VIFLAVLAILVFPILLTLVGLVVIGLTEMSFKQEVAVMAAFVLLSIPSFASGIYLLLRVAEELT